ncbi:MAG: acyl-CoA dehydrogenase [Deltaproteobacteria bacterium]|nr:MAG: acyl-CoA dehydrogenase [Deltaproteobacteria bacterium]
MPFDPNASFGKSLFFGEILEDQIFPYPEMPRDQTELVAPIVETIDRYMSSIDRRKLDREGEMPAELIQSLREMGLFGVIVPEEHGGLGLSNSGYARVMQQVSSWDGSIAVTLGAHSSIGFKGLLLFGTREQQKRYLPKLATGEMIAAFCLTEPGSGSDAFSIKTSARREGDFYLLNGQKLWITNGGIADFYTVFAKTTPDTPGQKGKITAFIVTRDLGGITHGPHEDKMGIRASNTTAVFFDNVRVPAANVLGEEGKGFKVAMSILNHGRTGLGAGAVGGQRRLLQLAVQHAGERKQFGRPIASFGKIKEKLGRMATNLYVSESLCYLVSATIDRGGVDYSIEGAATKIFNSEALWTAADEALQIAGGMGYMREQPYEQAVRDSRINRIFEGTNEILRLYVGFTGLQKPGEYLQGLGKELANSLADPIKGFGLLREYAVRKAKQTVPYGRTQITKAHESMREQVAYVEDAVQGLASLCETVLRRHGREIAEMQFATTRIADVAIDLLALCTAIARTTRLIDRRGLEKCSTELNMTFAFYSDARHRIRANLRAGTGRNNDEEIKSVADAVIAAGKYENDVLK